MAPVFEKNTPEITPLLPKNPEIKNLLTTLFNSNIILYPNLKQIIIHRPMIYPQNHYHLLRLPRLDYFRL